MCKIHKNDPRSVCSTRILRNASKEYKAHQTPNPKPTHYLYITQEKKKKKSFALPSSSNKNSILTPKIQMRHLNPGPRTRSVGVV